MQLRTLSGRLVNKATAKYKIKWDGKSLSKLQASVKAFLRDYWEGDIVYEEFPVFGTKMRLDFFNASRKIAIEVNGDQHDSFNKFFHNNSLAKFHSQIKRDQRKYEWCQINGITLVEIYTKDLPLSVEFFKRFGVDL